MSHNIVNFDAHAGADETITVTVQSSAGAVINIAGADIDFALGHRGPSGGRILTLGSSSTAQINITNSTGGVYQVSLDSAATIGFSGKYKYQSKVKSGGVESYVISGLVDFAPSLFTSTE